MSAISLKSITGITSITTPAGVDNQLTLHNNNTSEAVKLDVAGNIHVNNHIAITGVTTASQGVRVPHGSATTNYISVGDNGGLRFWATGHSYADIRSGNLHFRNASLQNVVEIQQDKDIWLYGPLYAQDTARFDSTVTISDTITHQGDTDTKIRFPAADTVTVEAAGSEKLRITHTTGIECKGETDIQNNILRVTDATPRIIMSVPSGGLDTRLYNDGSGNFIIGHGINSDTPTERLRIDSNGNVSIHSGAYGGGGTAPQLYVRGTGGRQVKIHNSNAGTSSLQITNGTTGEGEDAGTQLFTQGSTGDFHILNAFATGDIAFATKPSGGSTTEVIRITSDGRIGINKTNPNNYELDIWNRATADDAQIRLYNSGTGSGQHTFMRFQIAGTTASNYIYFGDSGDSNAGQIRYNHGSNYMSFHTNGTEQMRIRDNGAVTKPNNPIFFAYMDANTNHNSGNALKLDHTELNVGSGYNTSNYRFTPPVNGHYMFHASANIMLSNGEFTRAANVRLYKNGSLLTYQTGRNTVTGYQSSYPSIDGTFMVYGTTSDEFECRVTWETGGGNFSNLNTTETLHPHGTKFMGYLIG